MNRSRFIKRVNVSLDTTYDKEKKKQIIIESVWEEILVQQG